MVMDQPIRLGVVGLGLIWQAVHLPNLRALHDRFQVTRVCDLSASLCESMASELPGEVASSTDWRAVCDDPDVDAVLFLTPGDHAPQVLGALQAGKHVLVEKPLCVTVREARELERAATAAGRVLQVSYMKMYDPIIQQAREALGSVGARRIVRVTVLHPADAPQFEHVALRRPDDVDLAAIEADSAYAFERTGEALGNAPLALRQLYWDTLLASVSHELALLRALGIALPERFEAARAWPFRPDVPATEPPCLYGVADLGDGSVLQLSWAWLPHYPDYAEEVAVFGTQGRFRLEMPGPYLPAHRASLSVESVSNGIRASTTYRAGHTTGFVRELEAFAASVLEGASVLSTAAGAAADLVCMQQFIAAVAAGSGIAIETEAAA
jgi:predicted dehydrogenase